MNEAFESDYQGEALLIGEDEEGFEVFDREEGEDVEVEYAAELLSITGEEELDEFFSRLMRRAAGAARGILATQAGQQLKGLIRKTAGQALPLAGRAIGSYFGGSSGGDVGGTLGNAASQLFGIETEGLSPEDQDLEVARRVVRLANDATQRLTAMPPSADPRQAAGNALAAAAARHAPGLLRRRPRAYGDSYDPFVCKPRRSGQWMRGNGDIILFGVWR